MISQDNIIKVSNNTILNYDEIEVTYKGKIIGVEQYVYFQGTKILKSGKVLAYSDNRNIVHEYIKELGLDAVVYRVPIQSAGNDVLEYIDNMPSLTESEKILSMLCDVKVIPYTQQQIYTSDEIEQKYSGKCLGILSPTYKNGLNLDTGIVCCIADNSRNLTKYANLIADESFTDYWTSKYYENNIQDPFMIYSTY